MTRRLLSVTAVASLLLAALPSAPALALDEAARLWLVGERAFADGLHPLSRRVLERFVAEHPSDPRVPSALILLGRTRLALGEPDQALDAIRRVRPLAPPPAQQLEARFWEGEALYRLKRFAEARSAYDEVMQKDASSPLAPEAFYGLALCELELRRPEAALKAFREFTTTWPEHAQAPSAIFYTAHALVDLKRQAEAVPILVSFQTKYLRHKLAPDAQYLLGIARLAMGEREAGREDLRAFLAAHPSHSMASAARQAIAETPARSAAATPQKSTAKTSPSRETTQSRETTPPRETTSPRETTQPREPTESREPSASAEALYDAGADAGRAGRTREQEAAWRRLRKEFPNHPLAYRAAFEQAEASFKKKAYADAAAQAKAAAASPELRGRALLLGGESELKLNRYRDAAKSFEAAAAAKNIDSGDRYRALAGLGLAREELGELRQALDAYESVASKSPDSTLRNWARDRAAAVKGRLGKPAAGNEKRS